MRGKPSSYMGNRHIQRGERKIVYEDMTNLYGWSIFQYLPTGAFNEIEITKEKNLIQTKLRKKNIIDCGYQ